MKKSWRVVVRSRQLAFFIIFNFSLVLHIAAQPASVQPIPGQPIPGQPIPGQPVPNEPVSNEPAAIVPEKAVDSGPPADPESARLDLDIRTATFLELLAWCRDLKLSEIGSKAELATRLRNYYKLPPAPAAATVEVGDEKTISIVVESAQKTEYFTLEAVGEDYARLTGKVIVTLKAGDTVHRIQAGEIVYNRTKNLVSAYDNVEYSQTGGSSTEIFRGESLVVDLNDFSGVFLSGASEKGQKGETTAYRFKGDIISKTEDNVTVLGNATVETATNRETYWSLSASRIWLLPGSEWAVLNAVMKVGEVPVLYIPFFYLPSDEVVFHPVLGYRAREGSYVQTTTYLIGRPTDSTTTDSSIMKILEGNANVETVQDGIFLTKTGETAKTDDGKRLALLFDIYANLGAYLGFNLSLPQQGQVSKLDLSAGAALSRTVRKVGSIYTPYATDGSSEWDDSQIMTLTYPFRFRIKASGGLNLESFPLTWSLPVYSDPYIDQDFLNRSENMDWFNLIKQGAAAETAGAASSVLSTYEWRISTSYRPETKTLTPYINSFSISSAAIALSFNSKADTTAGQFSPDRTFFYPEKFSIISATATVSGRPFAWPSPLAVSGTSLNINGINRGAGSAKAADPYQGFGAPRSPWNSETDSGQVASADTDEQSVEKPKTIVPVSVLTPPDLNQRFEIKRTSPTVALEIAYSLNPMVSVDAYYRTDASFLKTVDDIRWDAFSSLLTTAKAAGDLSGRASLSNGLLDLSLSVKGNSTFQVHPYLNVEAAEYDTAIEQDNIVKRDYGLTNFDSTASARLSSKPFAGDDIWGNSSVAYALSGDLANSAFIGYAKVPEWKIEGPSWDAASIDSHSLSLNLAAQIRDQPQSLNLSAELPPRDTAVSLSSTFKWGISTSSLNLRAITTQKVFEFQPINFQESIVFNNNRSFTQQIVYSPELMEFTNLDSRLVYDNFTASFNASRSKTYSWDDAIGWRLSSADEELLPKNLIFAYRYQNNLQPLWKNRVSGSVDVASSLTLDLMRVTQSNLSFTLGASFKINEFMDLTFASVSQNSVIFRYIQDIPIFNFGSLELPGDKNMFIDLLKSFNFFREEDRRSSGFKLRSLSLTATHYLGDWNAKLSFSASPYLDSVKKVYRFNNAISFLVQWIPLSEFKTEFKNDKDGFAFK